MLLGTTFRLYNRRLLGWFVLALGLLLVACGSSSATDTPAAATDTVNPPTTETTDTAVSPARTGVLRVSMQPAVNLDPLAVSSDSEVLIVNHIYDYLVDIDPQSNPIPRLAQEWKVSEDGRTYTFTLAQGVTWHDGSPFTAQDVVWTFNRLRQTEGAPTADLYANIADITASGDLEVTFTLTNPNPFFLYDLSDNHALVVKDGVTDAASTFNGTGPFKVASYTPEDRMVLTANEAYFLPDEPKLAGVEIIFFNDETAAVAALRDGSLDLVMRMSIPLFESLKDTANIVTVDIPTNGFDLIRLRADRAPGNDPRVIQALKMTTDREAIFNVVQQGYGAVGNDSPIGPLYGAYHDPAVQPPAYDVAAAQALLKEAGYDETNPLQLTLHTPDTGNRPSLATVLAEQWAAAGVQVEISVEPESVYYAEDQADAGWLGVDLGITGWGSRPYPQFYLDVMLVSGAKWNESHFADPEFDQLVQIASSTLDEAERAKAYSDIQTILAQRGPIIIPYYFAQVGAYNAQFQGIELKAFAGRTDFRTVTFRNEN